MLLVVLLSWCSDIVPRLISCPFFLEAAENEGRKSTQVNCDEFDSQHTMGNGEFRRVKMSQILDLL